MPWRRSSRVLRALRVCPVCGSEAVSTLQRLEVERRRVPVSLRCGECGTWRGSRVRAGVADALDDALRHDLDVMADALVRVTAASRARGLHAPGAQAGVRPRRGDDRRRG